MEILGVDGSPARFAPARDRSGLARLPDVAPGQTKKVFKTWLSALDEF